MKRTSLVLLLAALYSSVFAGTVPPDSTIFPGQTGATLIASLISAYKSTSNLGYDAGRDTMYGVIDKVNDSLECVYCGYKIWMDPAQDPSTWAYDNDINCEHTWPQSLLSTTTAEGDLHHLFPTEVLVNGDRGNYPFAEINDASTTYWYYNNNRTTSIPSSNIDLYSECLSGVSFEPREQQKGNTARAMYYVLTMWQLADTNDAWWTGQRDILYTWHCNDPADAREITRTKKIATYQNGKVNPFVLDSTLIRRAYFPYLATNTSVSFSPTSATKAESAGSCSLKVDITSPSGTVATTVQVVLTGGTGSAADINNYTTQTLTFPAGSSATQSTVLTITDDALEEGTETLVFTLRNASGGSSATVGSDSVFTLTITDNDDFTAPVITSGPSVTGITSSTATVLWTTNEISNSWVYYGLTTSYSDTAKNESDVSSHSVGLSGLAASTTYHYKVSSTDPSDNGPTYSGDNTFTTSAPSGGNAFFYEPFDYPAGDSIAGIHNWTLHSGTANPIRVVAPGLSYDGYKGKALGNACSLFVTGEDVNRAFSSQSSGKVYASFLTRADSATAAGDYFFHLSTSPLNTSYFVGRVYARKDASNNLQFGLAKASEGATYSSNTYALKATYLLVLKYKISAGTTDDSVSLFVIDGAVPGSEPATATIGPLGASSTDPAAVGTVALRQGGSTTGAILKIDEIKIDTLWSNAPLGVDLINFTASSSSGTVIIRWTTGCENGTYQWQVERSVQPDSDYRIMAILPAQGNTCGSEYSWTDSSVEPDRYYYFRLKEFAANGESTTYGPVMAYSGPILNEGPGKVLLKVSPNPFSSQITFSLYPIQGAGVGLDIYNISGQKVRSFPYQMPSAGILTLTWNGRSLDDRPCPNGVYFYKLTAGTQMQTGRILLIR
jgi:endonuclease I